MKREGEIDFATVEKWGRAFSFPSVHCKMYGRAKAEVVGKVRPIRNTEGQEARNLPEVSEWGIGGKMASYKNLPLDLMFVK